MARRTEGLYARELARAAGGSLLFAFPLLMTMEMWWLGFYIDAGRFTLFLVVGFGLLLGLSRFAGFEPDEPWRDVVLDALSAYAVAVIVSGALLAIFGVLQHDMPLREIAGKIALVSIPAGIGALVARKQFQTSDDGADDVRARDTYGGELFLMLAGAVFIAFNVAPTEEIVLIAQSMTPWHALLLAAISLLALHVLVYSVEFRGQEMWPGERRFAAVFLTYSMAGYAIAVAVSLYVLWTFGRTDGMPVHEVATIAVVLGFPAALGAATARLVI